MDLDREIEKVQVAQKRLAQIQAELKGGEIEVVSPDRTVTVVVTTTGKVQSLGLADDTLERHDLNSLERAMLKTIQGAQQAATDVTEKAMRSVFPNFSLASLGLSDQAAGRDTGRPR